MRHAIYFTPASDHALTRAASAWLGRDAFGGEPDALDTGMDLTRGEIDPLIVSARRYGFHATLKAPFRLMDGQSASSLDDALAGYAATMTTFPIGRLVLTQIDGFFALIPEKPSPALRQFAGEVVEVFDPFRAPLSDAEIARRNPEKLAPAERDNLMRWGYPHVFDAFQFHMTLSDRVFGEDAARVRRALETVFDPLLDDEVMLDALALFVEPEPGAAFTVGSYHPFTRPVSA